jgi:hypothetical protein
VYPIKSSKHWLAYQGRVGAWNSAPVVPALGGATPSPTMPANEGISHEWKNFSIGTFGNDGANWISDDSTGD